MSNNPSPYDSPVSQGPSKTSGMAIASLVLGLLSFFTCVLTGIPAIILGIISLSSIKKSQGRLTGHGLAVAGLITGSIGSMLAIVFMLIGLLLPAVNAARESGRRVVSMNNMRHITTAMHDYENAKRHLPERASLSADGKPLLSWRVHLLPYLGHTGLYKQFHLDEAWDSPHNRTLIDLMPEIYASPSDPSKQKTLYLVPYGPGTIFEGTKSRSLQEIAGADGLADTIMLVEADPEKAVDWTRPDDWEFHRATPMAGLGNLRPGGFLAALADGAVCFIPSHIDRKTLAAMFTMNGHEAVPRY